MTPKQWDRIDELFAAALELPHERRAAYLAAATDDPLISGEVLSLLVAHDVRGRLDTLADQLRGLRPAAAALETAELIERLSAGLAGRYRIERELGRGGMAIVLLAEDLKHHRRVALKVLQPDIAIGIGPARFLQEIAIAAHLAHPHIVPLHDSGEAGGLLFYVMPYVEGETLRDRLRREGRLAVPDALQIARQVANALSYAHSHGVIHRDIKPENIMFQAGHAVVTDFGIARAMSVAGDRAGLNEAGIILGTPAYMSPEQVAGGEVDARSDVYSLGCVLYEMLAGAPPFNAVTVDAILLQHLEQTVRTLLGTPAAPPDAVDAAIQRALAKRPGERYGTAAEFAAALPEPGQVAASVRRRWVAAIASVGMVVATLTAGALFVRSRAPVPPAASVIAVLPLVPAARDSGLERIGRDLVVTLSASLDGVGGIRSVDGLTILAQTQQSGPLALAPGTQLAGLLGATSLVHGAIVRTGDRVRIDVGLFTAVGGDPIARASVIGDPHDLPALTDSLAGSLVRAVWRTREPPRPSLAAVTTRSLPALQAFLEGEHAGIESRWNDAAAAFARAMRADSTFWLAYWRYAYARWWYLEAVDDAVLAPLYAHRSSLPVRDRLVLESWWTDSFSVALARAQDAVTRYPDYWPGWMQYADWLFHVGPVYGHDAHEAQVALQRAVVLNPALVPAWEHLYWATLPHDTATAAEALAALQRLDFGQASTIEFGFDVTRLYRLELGLARSGGETIDQPLLDSLARDLVARARGRLGGGATSLQVQVELSRRVLRARPRPAVAAAHERLLADSWAGRGAWDSALAVAAPLDGYRLAVVGAWLGAVAPERADRHRSAAASAGRDSMGGAELAWLDGLLAAMQQDHAELAAARARVRLAGTITAPLLDSSLAAFEMDLGATGGEGRRQAARTLARLNWRNPDLLVPGYGAHPYVIAINRLAAAQWLTMAGDTAEASRVLMWFDAPWALDGYRPARRVLAGFASLLGGRLADRQGNVDRARRRYAEFIRRVDLPDRRVRQLVDEGKSALARLEAGRGSDQ